LIARVGPCLTYRTGTLLVPTVPWTVATVDGDPYGVTGDFSSFFVQLLGIHTTLIPSESAPIIAPAITGLIITLLSDPISRTIEESIKEWATATSRL
jgi:hypothetical protein